MRPLLATHPPEAQLVVERWKDHRDFPYAKYAHRRVVPTVERGQVLLQVYQERGQRARLWALWGDGQFCILVVNW